MANRTIFASYKFSIFSSGELSARSCIIKLDLLAKAVFRNDNSAMHCE